MKVLLSTRETLDFPTAINAQLAQNVAIGVTLLTLTDSTSSIVAAFRVEHVIGYWMDPKPAAPLAESTSAQTTPLAVQLADSINHENGKQARPSRRVK